MTKVKGWLQSYENRINSVLPSFLPEDKSILTKAIRYSVLSGGKRLIHQTAPNFFFVSEKNIFKINSKFDEN